jgi:hypothetical protein
VSPDERPPARPAGSQAPTAAAPQVAPTASSPAVPTGSSSAVPTASAPGAAHGERAPWLGDPRRCVIADSFLLALAAATLAACLLGAHSAARLLLLLAAACLIPGGALLTRLSVEDVLEAVGLAVGLGFSIEAVGTLAMIWTGWWHPFGWALVLVGAACALLALDLRRSVTMAGRSW